MGRSSASHDPQMSGPALLLQEAVAASASATSLIADGEHISFEELDVAAARYAGALAARGVAAGDRVGVLLPNGPAFVAAYYGALRLGAIVAPLNPILSAAEIEARLRHADARVVVLEASRLAEPRPSITDAQLLDPSEAAAGEPRSGVIDAPEEATAVLIGTSGTTGVPKAAELTHGGLAWIARAMADTVFALTARDVLFGAAPLSHVFGQVAAMNTAIAGRAAVVLVERFDAAEALTLVKRHGVSVLLGVPTMSSALLEVLDEEAEPPPSLRILHSGGAPMPPALAAEVERRLGCALLDGYGLTETSGGVSSQRLDRPRKAGSVGSPIEPNEVRIAGLGAPEAGGQPGEILVRGPGVMRGYWRDPEATSAAFEDGGWLRTGDLGYRDADGDLFLVDRLKEVILRGGYNVYPAEVEAVLCSHPGVLEAAIVGIPDERLGQEVGALVVAREPAAPPDPDVLIAFVKERVAGYKYPRSLLLTDALPHSPSGKLLRREIDPAALRALSEDRVARERRRRPEDLQGSR